MLQYNIAVRPNSLDKAKNPMAALFRNLARWWLEQLTTHPRK